MKIPKLIIPILVVITLFGGYFLRYAFTQPSTNVIRDETADSKSVFIVDGLKCKGTAAFFTALYDSIPGIQGIETFATEHKAIISYNSELIDIDSIKAVMEAEIHFDDGTSARVFKCLSAEQPTE